MFKRTLAIGLILVFGNAWSDPLDDVIGLFVGSFSSAAQAREDERYGTAVWHIAEIWPDRGRNSRWLYIESWINDAPAPYLQRISRVVASEDGSIVITRYKINDADNFVGAWQSPGSFDVINKSDLTEVAGCETILARTGKSRYEGSTLGASCRNSFRGAAYAVSQTVLTTDSITNWDRGFAADGAQVWGTPHGGYELRRLEK